jgi:hypothetical protein
MYSTVSCNNHFTLQVLLDILYNFDSIISILQTKNSSYKKFSDFCFHKSIERVLNFKLMNLKIQSVIVRNNINTK